MHELTSIQQQVYDYTRQILEQGLPFPSLREIAGHFGFKHTTARFHLKALEKKGYSIFYPAWYNLQKLKGKEQKGDKLWEKDQRLQNSFLWSKGEYTLFVFEKP